MKIGILQTAYKKADDYGKFYNVQELGLARALAAEGHDVTLFKAVDGAGCEYKECDGRLLVKLISVKYLGINGLLDVKSLDPTIEKLIYFCDTQIIVPKVYRWCINNSIEFIPYVGVMESHSESGIKREVMDFLSKRNLKVYKKCNILAKTPKIKEFLQYSKCTSVKLVSVGLDETVMNHAEMVMDCGETVSNRDDFRILFIGRMEEEKHPLEMLTIFEKLLDREAGIDAGQKKFSLVMIGDGYMFDEVETASKLIRKKYNLDEDRLQLIRKVEYSEMHRYYRSSDVYVNLNRVEILGMSILEAMYYECPVIAIDAPGPRFILAEDEVCGIITGNADEVEEKIVRLSKEAESYREMVEKAKNRVRDEFTWSSIAKKICR